MVKNILKTFASRIHCVPKHMLITKKQMSKEENKLMLYSGCLDC
jgi:hypothetical protein